MCLPDACRASVLTKKVSPDILGLPALQLLLSKLAVRERTLALLDAATGLRVSELLALRWRDVDFENLELRVPRSIWHQVVSNCKTGASAKPVPMDTEVKEEVKKLHFYQVAAGSSNTGIRRYLQNESVPSGD